MKNRSTNKAEEVSKGYRLRTETHRLVARVQKKIEGTKDDVISKACAMYFNSLTDSDRNTDKNIRTKTKKQNKKTNN